MPTETSNTDSLQNCLARIPSFLWVLLASLLGFGVASVLVMRLLPSPHKTHTLPSVHFLGEPLALDENATTRALERLRQHVSGLFSLTIDGVERRVSFGDLGVELDKARLAQLLKDTVDPTSPLSRWRRLRGVASTEPVVLPVPIRLDSERLIPLLVAIKDEHERAAVDARLDLAERKVLPSVDGLLVDVDKSALSIERALSRGESSSAIETVTIAPARRTEDLNDVRFDHVLSVFETPYDRSDKARARTYNLRLAASRLDGTVLLPGETFDFNRVVGPRDEANGYRVAPVIAEGELVDGIGGGTCQVSGTLHGAAFFAGLDIVERYPHTRPSSYIKLGLDATVVYPTINFRFSNPYDFPVVLHETVANGTVRAEILGPETDSAVTLIRRIVSAKPYDEVERPDARLESGHKVLAQRGVPGFKVQMYRITRKGPHADREAWSAQYPPTTQVVLVGTSQESAKRAPKEDTHPEYTADELLIVTQQTRPNGGEPEVVESREPGRFGLAGWTTKAGMPSYDPGG